MHSNTAAVILAAGLGKRMKSDLPKILHNLNGKYLIDHVIDNVKHVGVEKVVLVIGHKHELIEAKLADRGVDFVVQIPQLGTGHAVQKAVPALGDFSGDLLVLCGDMPLVSPATISNLLKMRRETDSAATVLTVILADPGSYGRIVRHSDGSLKAIIEYRDADEKTRLIKEVNTASYCFDYQQLMPVLDQLKAENAQSEYYLTDTIHLLNRKGLKVTALTSDNPNEGLGVNSQEELDVMETLLREQIS